MIGRTRDDRRTGWFHRWWRRIATSDYDPGTEALVRDIRGISQPLREEANRRRPGPFDDFLPSAADRKRVQR